jgi:hypothetical protein
MGFEKEFSVVLDRPLVFELFVVELRNGEELFKKLGLV